MNRYTRLQLAIRDLKDCKLEDDSVLFKPELAEKLQQLHDLMEFPMVTNKDFHTYLALFQNDVLLDIERCKNVWMSKAEKEAAFQAIKQHAETRLKAVKFACAYYLKDTSILFDDEDNQRFKPKAKLRLRFAEFLLQHLGTHTPKHKAQLQASYG